MKPTMAYQRPYQEYRPRTSYSQNPWVMAIARMIAERQEQPQLSPEQMEMERQAAVGELRAMPNQPYLEGLSPLARYKDMFYRDQGRSMAVKGAVEEAKAGQGLVEDFQMGVTRQPDGRVTTEAGGVIAPAEGYPSTRSLTSPYGKGSAVGVPSKGGTFSFTTADGTVVTAPFSSLRDSKFMKFMREEELGRQTRNPQIKPNSNMSAAQVSRQLAAGEARDKR